MSAERYAKRFALKFVSVLFAIVIFTVLIALFIDHATRVTTEEQKPLAVARDSVSATSQSATENNFSTEVAQATTEAEQLFAIAEAERRVGDLNTEIKNVQQQIEATSRSTREIDEANELAKTQRRLAAAAAQARVVTDIQALLAARIEIESELVRQRSNVVESPSAIAALENIVLIANDRIAHLGTQMRLMEIAAESSALSVDLESRVAKVALRATREELQSQLVSLQDDLATLQKEILETRNAVAKLQGR